MKINDYYKEEKYIRYSNCHEDMDFVLGLMQDRPKKILSIASSLDNCLAMLLKEPEEIVAFDSNETQIYLCRLKKCGIKHLDRDSFLTLLGIDEGDSGACYGRIREYLDEETREYFDSRLFLITDVKLVNCGRFEYYFSIFKNKVLPLIHREKTIDAFMNANSIEEQKRIYFERFNNVPFKAMFKLFFSEAVMKRLGREKDYFKYNSGSLSDLQKTQFEKCIQNNLNKDNPYLQYIIYNRFIELPCYLREENYGIIKKNIDRLTIKKAEFTDIVRSGERYDFMYLSDIFEYMDDSVMPEMTEAVGRGLNEGGRVLYFNMMNDRKMTDVLSVKEIDQRYNRTFYYMKCYLCGKER